MCSSAPFRKELSQMGKRYRPYPRVIRFFPHIVPIAFPLIFPVGFFLASWLFHAIFTLLAILLGVALAVFIIRAITLGIPDAAWNSMKNMGNQWQHRSTSKNQQPPQYRQQLPPDNQPQQPYTQPGKPGPQ